MGILAKIRQLKTDLAAVVVIQEEEMDITNVDISYTRGVPNYVEGSEIITHPRITQPNTQKRAVARMDLQQIYDESKWYQFIRKHLAKNALESERENF